MIKFNENQLISLIQNDIRIETLELGFIQLNRGIEGIDILEIIEIYVDKQGIDGCISDNSTYTFKERLEQFEKFDGWIHFAGGLSCSIQNRKISNLRITKRYLKPISHITRNEIVGFYGKPDYELVDDITYGGYDYRIDNYILIYKNKRINFLIDPKTEFLNEIDTMEYELIKYPKR